MHPFAELQVPRGSIGIHWFEQNAFALKDSEGTIVLIDPFFPHERPPERFIRPTPPLIESELPTTYVLLTHAHMDHTHPETLTRIHAAWPEARYVGPKESIARILAETDIDEKLTLPIAADEGLALGPLVVWAFYSKPPQGDPAANIPPPNVTHLGYLIGIEKVKVYVTGDAINTLADQEELVRSIAAMQPDIGLITTHPTEGEFPFFEDTVRLAQKLRLTTVVPSHYECFVKRTYDPKAWAALFPPDGPKPLIIPWNSHLIYP